MRVYRVACVPKPLISYVETDTPDAAIAMVAARLTRARLEVTQVEADWEADEWATGPKGIPGDSWRHPHD
jgi:hypothetical protein